MELPDERRNFQRLHLAKPIHGRLGLEDVLILDIGVLGTLVEHQVPIEAGEPATLTFRWEDESLQLECEAVRSTIERSMSDGVARMVYHTGLRFLEAVGNSDERLRAMISSFVHRILRAQVANAEGDREGNRIEDDQTLTGVEAARRARLEGYLNCRYENGHWKKVHALLPDQPREGFTVAGYEVPEEVDRLCRAYEQTDSEGRKLIRLIAELTVSKAQHVPPTKD